MQNKEMQQPEPRNSRSTSSQTVGESIHSTYAGGGRGRRAKQAHQWPKAVDQREREKLVGRMPGRLSQAVWLRILRTMTAQLRGCGEAPQRRCFGVREMA